MKVKVRRDPAWRTWGWRCAACDTGGFGSAGTPWEIVLEAANRHARQDWHQEKVERGRS